MNRVKLSTVLKSGPGAIMELGGRLARGEIILDGGGVDTLAPEQLEDLVIRQLLGPWDGPEEVVDEATVRGRYLVGMLAPRASSGIPEEYDDGDLGGSDGEDGSTDAPPPKATTAMLPSSIGLTFAV